MSVLTRIKRKQKIAATGGMLSTSPVFRTENRTRARPELSSTGPKVAASVPQPWSATVLQRKATRRSDARAGSGLPSARDGTGVSPCDRVHAANNRAVEAQL